MLMKSPRLAMEPPVVKRRGLAASCRGAALAMTLLLVGSLFVPALAYAGLAVGAFFLAALPACGQFALLLYLMPFAPLFKAAPGGTSFFTLLELWTLALRGAPVKAVDRRMVAALALLGLALTPRTDGVTAAAKVFVNLLLVYAFARGYRDWDAPRYAAGYVAGLLVSSALGVFKERIPRLLAMYSDLNYELLDGVPTLRFSGTFPDPNYYAAALLVGMLLCIRGLHARPARPRTASAAALLALTACGLLSYSKSFWLALGLVCAVLLATSRRPGPAGALLLAGCALLCLCDPGGILERMAARFSEQELGTGRAEIWRDYLQSVTAAPSALLFGHGLTAQLARPAHSLLLETLYAVGLVGAACWALAVAAALRAGGTRNRGRLWGAGYLAVFAVYGLLNGLFDHALPFLLMGAYVFAHTGVRRGRKGGAL